MTCFEEIGKIKDEINKLLNQAQEFNDKRKEQMKQKVRPIEEKYIEEIRNIYIELNTENLDKEQLENLMKKIEIMEAKRKEETSKVIKPIDEKTAEKVRKITNEIQIQSEKLNEIYLLIEKYSEFNTKEIGFILTKIMNEYEGENYYFMVASNLSDENLKRNMAIIVSEENKNISYDMRYKKISKKIFQLCNERKMLILDSSNTKLPEKIKFYYFDNVKFEIQPTIDLRKFEYIQEFINNVILYKIENEIIHIDKDQMCNLIEEFKNNNCLK